MPEFAFFSDLQPSFGGALNRRNIMAEVRDKTITDIREHPLSEISDNDSDKDIPDAGAGVSELLLALCTVTSASPCGK